MLGLFGFQAVRDDMTCRPGALTGTEKVMMRSVIAMLAVAFFGLAAQAQNVPGPSDTARFTFYRVGDIFLRLDVQTGHVSECSWVSTGWTCKVAPDERMTLETEIDRLSTSNLALKKELLAHGLALPGPGGIKPDPALDKRIIGETRMPAVGWKPVTGYVANVWRRMVAMVANLQRDMFRKG